MRSITRIALLAIIIAGGFPLFIQTPVAAAEMTYIAPPCTPGRSIEQLNNNRSHGNYSNEGGIALDMGADGAGRTPCQDSIARAAIDGEIVASKTFDFTVTRCVVPGRVGTKGTQLVIRNAQTGVEVLYAHLDFGAANTKRSGTVRKGDIIGTISDKGCASFRHIHLVVSKNGRKLPYAEWRFEEFTPGCEGSLYQSSFDFSKADNCWAVMNGMRELSRNASGTTYAITGNDPHLQSQPLNLNLADFQFVDIYLSATTPFKRGCGQVFVMFDNMRNYDERYSKNFDLTSDTTARIRVTPDRGALNGLNTIKRLRIDPGCNNSNQSTTVTISKVVLGTEDSLKPVYRFWSDDKQGHFYTISEAEKNDVILNYPDNVWKYEGIAFHAYDSRPFIGNIFQLMPVYRFWSDEYQAHFYTINEAEKNDVINNRSNVWRYESIAFYAYTTGARPGSVPVYRFWSERLRNHFFTINESEKTSTMSNPDWKYEGVAFYVMP